ncbi:ABC transporter permease [uncultured Ruminococcus sp.]|uniref:ABC transporter permease n=1 Tax=uncultured Ruminococcus sp. TaxID=165186 RepID=UPI0025E3E702|nr:ABC transporter permease [uncultured Ruminococcus sp.]
MFLDNIRLAFSELSANKMRSLLTMLGIVIGIASVIAIMTLGEGMQNSMMDTFGGEQAKQIAFEIIQKDMKNDYDQDNFDINARPMNENDMFDSHTFDSIQARFGERLAGISLSADLGKILCGEEKFDLRAVNPCAFSTEGEMDIVAGRCISRDEYEKGRKVMVMPKEIAEKIYGSAEEAVGKEFEGTLGSNILDFTVVGVFERKKSGMEGMLISTPSTKGYVPYASALDNGIENEHYEYFITIAKNTDDIPALEKEIGDYLNTGYADNDTYKVFSVTMQTQLDMINTELGIYKAILAAIAAISLLVGGIGVMNIMIVSITERTREIGTRKALGATNRDIRGQFLIESIIICLIGSAIGIGLGLLGGSGLASLMGVKGTASVSSIVVSVLISMAFGLFFGLYPANKAAKMNPIDALRYE